MLGCNAALAFLPVDNTTFASLRHSCFRRHVAVTDYISVFRVFIQLVVHNTHFSTAPL